MTASEILNRYFNYNVASDVAPIELRGIRDRVVPRSMQYLLNNDYSTQNYAGKLIDDKFRAKLSEFRKMDNIVKREYSDKIVSVLGWDPTNRNTISIEGRDNTALFISVMAACSNVQVSPNDITLNSFRLWDILRLLMSDSYSESTSFYDYGDFDEVELYRDFYIRLKYFEFVADQINGSDVPYDHFVLALFSMPIHQLVVVLTHAFRVFESKLERTQIRLKASVLEPDYSSDDTVDDLLNHTRITDTIEWVKLYPLIGFDISKPAPFLNSTKIKLPFSISDDFTSFIYSEWKYLHFAPSVNFSFFDYKEEWNESIFTEILDLFKTESLLYLQSYAISIRGYWLAEDDLSISLTDLFRDTVLPDMFETLLISRQKMQNDFSLYIGSKDSSDCKELSNRLKDILSNSVDEIFTMALDFSSRLILSSRAVSGGDANLPLFFSVTAQGEFTTSSFNNKTGD